MQTLREAGGERRMKKKKKRKVKTDRSNRLKAQITCVHLNFSPPSPLISFSARSIFTLQSSMLSSRLCTSLHRTRPTYHSSSQLGLSYKPPEIMQCNGILCGSLSKKKFLNQEEQMLQTIHIHHTYSTSLPSSSLYNQPSPTFQLLHTTLQQNDCPSSKFPVTL